PFSWKSLTFGFRRGSPMCRELSPRLLRGCETLPLAVRDTGTRAVAPAARDGRPIIEHLLPYSKQAFVGLDGSPHLCSPRKGAQCLQRDPKRPPSTSAASSPTSSRTDSACGSSPTRPPRR